jgi:STE24 endopeptidase
MNMKVFWMDYLKSTIVFILIGVPLAFLFIYGLIEAGKDFFWIGLCFMIGCYILTILLVPNFILPLFNKFTELPENSLRR